MFTEAQTLYLNDVLGVNPSAFRPAMATAPALLVLAYPATADEAQLLAKILASVPLGEFERQESLTPPEDHGAPHILVFGGGLS